MDSVRAGGSRGDDLACFIDGLQRPGPVEAEVQGTRGPASGIDEDLGAVTSHACQFSLAERQLIPVSAERDAVAIVEDVMGRSNPTRVPVKPQGSNGAGQHAR